MTFNEILSQAIAMLQQHGRLSYRSLKRQFDIDDAYLEKVSFTRIRKSLTMGKVSSGPANRVRHPR